MNLAQTQKVLWKLITQPDASVAKVAPRIVQSTPEFPAGRRVTVYADMYFWRCADALRGDYPKLAELLSDDEFWALARRYLKAHPSRHHDLGRAGWMLPEFLKRSKPKGARADLADLATLEWARDLAFIAKDAAPLTLADMAQVGPERFAQVRLTFVPSVQLVSVKHDVAAVWRAVEQKTKVPKPKRAAQHLVVWRKGFEAFHSVIDAREAKALALAMSGKKIAQVLLPFGADTQAAFNAIGSWVREEMVAAAK